MYAITTVFISFSFPELYICYIIKKLSIANTLHQQVFHIAWISLPFFTQLQNTYYCLTKFKLLN